MTPVTDDFNRADGGLGANWIAYTGVEPLQIASNQAETATTGGAVDSMQRYNITPPDDQWAQITIKDTYAGAGNVYGGVILRARLTDALGYYALQCRQSTATHETKITRVDPGTGATTLASNGTTWLGGDVLYGQAVGSALTINRNGVFELTVSDSTYPSGGFGAECYSDDLVSSLHVDDWSGGSAIADQEGFRFRNDDGGESVASWLTAQDTNIRRNTNLNTRLRVLVNATGDLPSTPFQLEYRRNGGAWRKVLNA
jgi:hypothetical protein